MKGHMGLGSKEFCGWSPGASRNMLFQVENKDGLEYQEIQGTLFSERICPE